MKQRVVRVYMWLCLIVLFFAGCQTDSDNDDPVGEAIFGETSAQVYDLDDNPFTGNYTVNVRFLNADGKKRDVKVGTIENGKLTFAIFQSLLPNEDELESYPAMPGITMTLSDLKVARWEFCLTETDAAAATLGLEYRKTDQSIMGSYGRSCQYFSSDATITGSVSDTVEGMPFTISLQIDAKKGWNRTYEVFKMSEEGIESSMTTSPAGIPSDCQWSFRNLSEEFRSSNDNEVPSYVKQGEITFQVDSSNGPRFFSLSTGEWVDASEAASKNWDIAFQRMRKIYTNSGTSAQEFSSDGKGGVWYTNKTDFDAVTSKDDAVTDLPSIHTPYITDQTRYTGTSSGSLARINLMTYMGYLNEATASGTTKEDFLMYASGEGANYLPTAFYDIDQEETGQVYIIRHADGETYAKIQVYDFEFISSSVAPSGLSTDSYKVRYAVFK